MTDGPAMRYDSPRNRVGDNSELARVTGYSNVRSLVVNVVGGLTIAGLVGALSIWGTQLVLGEQIGSLSRQITNLREEVRDIRRDLYEPRWRERRSGAVWQPIWMRPPAEAVRLPAPVVGVPGAAP